MGAVCMLDYLMLLKHLIVYIMVNWPIYCYQKTFLNALCCAMGRLERGRVDPVS